MTHCWKANIGPACIRYYQMCMCTLVYHAHTHKDTDTDAGMDTGTFINAGTAIETKTYQHIFRRPKPASRLNISHSYSRRHWNSTEPFQQYLSKQDGCKMLIFLSVLSCTTPIYTLNDETTEKLTLLTTRISTSFLKALCFRILQWIHPPSNVQHMIWANVQ